MTHRPTEIDVRIRLDRIKFSVRHMLGNPFLDLADLDRISQLLNSLAAEAAGQAARRRTEATAD